MARTPLNFDMALRSTTAPQSACFQQLVTMVDSGFYGRRPCICRDGGHLPLLPTNAASRYLLNAEGKMRVRRFIRLMTLCTAMRPTLDVFECIFGYQTSVDVHSGLSSPCSRGFASDFGFVRHQTSFDMYSRQAALPVIATLRLWTCLEHQTSVDLKSCPTTLLILGRVDSAAERQTSEEMTSPPPNRGTTRRCDSVGHVCRGVTNERVFVRAVSIRRRGYFGFRALLFL